MIVMHTVNQKVKALAKLSGDLPMEEIAVADIFGQCPRDVTKQHAAERGGDAHLSEAETSENRDDRRIDAERNRPVHARKSVEERVLEQTRRGGEVIRHGAIGFRSCIHANDLWAVRAGPP